MKLFPKLGYIDFISGQSNGGLTNCCVDPSQCHGCDHHSIAVAMDDYMSFVKIFNIDGDGSHADTTKECFEYYKKHQIVVLRPNPNSKGNASQTIGMEAIKALLADFPSELMDSLTIENTGSVLDTTSSSNRQLLDTDVVSQGDDGNRIGGALNKVKKETEVRVAMDIINNYNTIHRHCSWYLSFIAQKSSALLDRLSNMLPFSGYPPILDSWGYPMHHFNSFWVFVGNSCHDLIHHDNMSKGRKDHDTSLSGLQGRSEHTDAVTHSGTWHYQLSGSKVWMVRPCLCDEWTQYGGIPVLQQQRRERPTGPIDNETCSVHRGSDGLDRLHLDCRAGDVLIINTRLWWHQTLLPSVQTKSNLSISVARDFSFQPVGISSIASTIDDEYHLQTVTMTNCDGIYASRNLKRGEIICTEDDLPDCSLPRTKTADEANSEMSWMKIPVNGTKGRKYKKMMVLIAKRPIKSGEWFTIVESDEEDG